MYTYIVLTETYLNIFFVERMGRGFVMVSNRKSVHTSEKRETQIKPGEHKNKSSNGLTQNPTTLGI